MLRWLAADVSDDVGGFAHRERVGAGRRVLGAGVVVGARECRGGDRGDVLGVDKRLGAVTSGHRDHAVDRLQERLAEILHEPGGTQNGMCERLAPMRSSSTARWATWGGAWSMPNALR